MSEQQTLSDRVSQLIETISSLVLCTITGEARDIGTHAKNLGQYTLIVVNYAKEIALASKSREITLKIIDCNNNITNGIEKLVTAVVALLQNFQNPDLKKAFAEAARDAGLAINQLISAADSAVSQILINTVEPAKQYQQELLKSASGAVEEFVELAKHCGQYGMAVITQGNDTARNCAVSSKAGMISHAVGEVRVALAEFIKAARTVQQNPGHPDAKGELASAYKNLARIYADIIEAALIRADYSADISDAFAQFNRLLDLAKAARLAASSLFDAAMRGCSVDEMTALAREAIQSTMDLISQAMQALESETDPIRREQIQQAINETKEAMTAMVRAARELQADPNNPQLRQNLVNAKQALDRSVDKLVALTSKGMEEEKLRYTTEYLQQVCDEMWKNAPHLTAEQLLEYANRIGAITERVAKDAKAVAMKTEDPEKRNEILTAVSDLRKAEDRYINDIKSLSRNPGNPELLQRLGKTHELFKGQIQKIRYITGIDEQPAIVHHAQQNRAGDSDLVNAAKEQAALAMQIIKDAEAILVKMSDPAAKQKLQNAILRVKNSASNVVHFAEIAAADPNNLGKQIQLDDAQRDLSDGIRDVVTLTSNAAVELQQLLDMMAAQDEGSAGELFGLADQFLREISEFIANLDSMNPKDVVNRAKELAAFANRLAALVRKIADETEDPKTKEELIGFSRFLRDRGTQLKMIAAVKVACGGDAGQVSSAAAGLRTTITETVSVLRVYELKRRRKRTANRPDQIRRIIALWQQSR